MRLIEQALAESTQEITGLELDMDATLPQNTVTIIQEVRRRTGLDFVIADFDKIETFRQLLGELVKGCYSHDC